MKSGVCAGELRHRITIQTRIKTPDGYGGYSDDSWTPHAEVWSKIVPYSARERFFAGKLEHNVTHKITLRFLSTITESMRVSYGGRTFKIIGIINKDERSIWTELFCEEGAGD